METKNYSVSRMHCNGCANTVKSALLQVEGIHEVAVNFEEATASLQSTKPAEVEILNKALSTYGDFELSAKN